MRFLPERLQVSVRVGACERCVQNDKIRMKRPDRVRHDRHVLNGLNLIVFLLKGIRDLSCQFGICSCDQDPVIIGHSRVPPSLDFRLASEAGQKHRLRIKPGQKRRPRIDAPGRKAISQPAEETGADVKDYEHTNYSIMIADLSEYCFHIGTITIK